MFIPYAALCRLYLPTPPSMIPSNIERMLKGWDIQRIAELRTSSASRTETDDESQSRGIAIAQNVSASKFIRKIPEKGIGCKIALVVRAKERLDLMGRLSNRFITSIKEVQVIIYELLTYPHGQANGTLGYRA
jgi:hypothetical protein